MESRPATRYVDPGLERDTDMKRPSALLASAIPLCTACARSTPSSPGNSPIAAPSATPAASPTGTTPPGPTGLAGIEVAKADAARLAADPGRAVVAATAVNAFGLDLYARLAATPGNLAVSPASLAIALSMARAGARRATATEMDAVLHDLGSDADAEAVNALDAALTARSGPFPDVSGLDQDVSLRIANALFAQRGMTLEPGFLETMAGRFGAGVGWPTARRIRSRRSWVPQTSPARPASPWRTRST